MKNKKNLIILVAAIIAAGAAGWFFIGQKQPAYNLLAVGTGDIKEEVKAGGSVKAAEEVALAFERSGRLTKVSVKVGDHVAAGQPLAYLDSADLAAQLAQAQAGYSAQTARLDEVKRGARGEDLNISQTKIASAENQLADAKNNLTNIQDKAVIDLANLESKNKNILDGAYNQAYDALNIKLDPLFIDEHTDSPKISFSTNDPQAENDIKSSIVQSFNDLNQWRSSLDALGSDSQSQEQALADGIVRLSSLRDFTKKINSLLKSAVTSSNFSAADLIAYKNGNNAASANINAAISSLNGQLAAISGQKALNQSLIAQAQTQVDAANNAVNAAKSELAMKQAGASGEQVQAQAAAVAQAAASIEAVRAQLAKMVLLSPLNGIVTKQDGKVGQLVQSAPIISLMSDAKFQIETQIAESDIAKIKIGQKAAVTLDAYGAGREFDAAVISIDPAPSVINNISGYKVTLEFSRDDADIKPGLSANVKILIQEKKQVMLVPTAALIKDGLNNYVLVNGQDKRAVQIGIASADGQTEIISGLTANDKIADLGGLNK